MALLDLSMPITPGMPVNRPDHQPPHFQQYASIPADGWEGTLVTIDTHCGTHVDAPSHFVAGGATVDQIPLSVLTGPATRLNLDNRQWPDALAPRVVVHTGWSDRLGEDPEGYFTRYSHLTAALAEWLVDAGVRLVGIDTPSIDGTDDAAHQILLGAGVVVVENLANTARLPESFTLTVLPLALGGLDGSPARAFAEFEVTQ